MSIPQLILIPGLGADKDPFYPQQEHFGERLFVLDDPGADSLWQQKPSMETAAEAFLQRLTSLLDGKSDYVLGGMSFGGSLAVEMARRIVREKLLPPPRTLALIASHRTAGTISRGFRINRLIGAAVPRPLVRGSLRGLAGVFARREGLSPEHRNRLREMAGRTKSPGCNGVLRILSPSGRKTIFAIYHGQTAREGA
ncbi:MAG: thioesterase domain-containing protein [Planctomycetaceae bacterium]|nr:thioesterase domain-containing protein [Planctomycetaceae bacterium]